METETNNEQQAQFSQKDAVFGYALHVLGLESETIPKTSMTKEVKKQVKELLVQGFKEGVVSRTSRVSDDKLSKLASGLVSNWIKKDKRFV